MRGATSNVTRVSFCSSKRRAYARVHAVSPARLVAATHCTEDICLRNPRTLDARFVGRSPRGCFLPSRRRQTIDAIGALPNSPRRAGSASRRCGDPRGVRGTGRGGVDPGARRLDASDRRAWLRPRDAPRPKNLRRRPPRAEARSRSGSMTRRGTWRTAGRGWGGK